MDTFWIDLTVASLMQALTLFAAAFVWLNLGSAGR